VGNILLQKIYYYAFGIVSRIEKKKFAFYHYLIFFFTIIQLRNLLEDFSAHTGLSFEMHLHFNLYYVCIVLSILLILKLITGEETTKTFRSVSLFFSTILVGPVVDIIISGAGKSQITYYFNESAEQLIARYFSFFGEYVGYGATTGLKIHVFFILIFLFIYTLIKTGKNFFKGFLTSFIVYNILFLSSIFPLLVEKSLGIKYSDRMMILLFWPASLCILTALFYKENKQMFLAIVKDSRPERMIYYLLLVGMGAGIGYQKFQIKPEFSGLCFVIICLSLVLAIYFSIVTNNLADYEIDKISNPGRPLFKYDFSKENYVAFGCISLLLSLVGSAIISYQAFFCVLLFIGLYYIYSMPPLRFKRVPFFSKLVISINSLLASLLGYSLYLTPNSRGYYFLSYFPEKFTLFFLILTFSANFIDLKDYEGDKAEGIKTLPVVLGLEEAKVLMALFFSFPYFYIIYLFPELKLGCYFFIGLNSWLLIKKNYDEKRLFVSFLISIVFLIFYLVKN
jgi:4-hydroxybenzoate polyprenyltransferase